MKLHDKSSRRELSNDDFAAYLLMQSTHTHRYLLQQRTPIITIDWITEQDHDDRVVATEILYTPWGNLHLDYTQYGIRNAYFTSESLKSDQSDNEIVSQFSAIWGGHHEWLKSDEFWQGKLSLRVKLHVRGTLFQRSVWNTLAQIPYGGVLSYGDLAVLMQQPRSVRAVASAVARNPVAWFVPCHRIVRRNGEVGQYRWSTDRKEAMLRYEKAMMEQTHGEDGVQTVERKD